MELIEIIQQVAQSCVSGMEPTDFAAGTVTNATPLEITLEDTRIKLPAAALLLTSAVIERKIPILTHVHNTSGLAHEHSFSQGQTQTNLTGTYPSDTQLGNIFCYEQGKPLPIQDNFIILNRALQVGDKVLLLRVQHGQAFLVLSRVFET